MVSAGKFGERWTNLCKSFGVTANVISIPYGQAVDPKAVAVELEKHPETRREMRYERFDPVRAGDPLLLNAERMMYRLAFTRPVYAVMRRLANVWLGPVTYKALDYLVQYHYLAGLREPRLAPPLEARRA